MVLCLEVHERIKAMDSVNVVHDRINAIGPASVRLTLIETHGVHSHEPTKHEIHFFRKSLLYTYTNKPSRIN